MTATAGAEDFGEMIWWTAYWFSGDSQGKAKHNKWAEVKDVPAADAQKKYVAAVKKLVAKYK
jgi:acyl-CoA-binding protein